MMKIERFEDIEAWKKARELVAAIYRITEESQFSRDYGLRDQIRRSAVSIMSNIAEGFSRQTNKEFIQFLFIAKGSASELQSQLYIALDLGYVSESKFQEIYDLATDALKLISGLIRHLKNAAKR